jgi:hypothetical protein
MLVRGWSGGPSAGADVGDAGLVVDLGALAHVAAAVAWHLVVEGVWSAGCDGVYVVDLEAEWVVVVGFVVDGLAAVVARWVVAERAGWQSFGDGVSVFVSGLCVAWCARPDHQSIRLARQLVQQPVQIRFGHVDEQLLAVLDGL